MCGRDVLMALAIIERAELLCEAHGLTPAEHRVALALMTARTPQEIATHLSMSRGTLNDHRNVIFRKFGVTGRIELLGMLLGHTIPERQAA
jgi:DNA-binding CsgD family transcriptional regulator